MTTACIRKLGRRPFRRPIPKSTRQTTDKAAAGYLTSNAIQQNEGSIAHLIDGITGDMENYFHSTYSDYGKSEDGLDHYLLVDLGEGASIADFNFNYHTRTGAANDYPVNILIEGMPRVMGVREILEEWTAWRTQCVRRRIYFQKEKKAERLHLLKGLERILLDIDKAIAIIRETELESEVVPNLMIGFGIDEVQANYVAEIKLRNLNREYILNRTAEIEKLIEEIADLEDLISSDRKIKKLISKQLTEISKKYAIPRKTELVSETDIVSYTEVETVDDYPLTLFFTRDNYLKKIPHASLRMSTTEHKLKDGDEILQEIETSNGAEVLMFTDKSTVYKMKLNDIPDAKVSTMGEYVPAIAGAEADEKFVYIVVTTDYRGLMLYAFENGKMAKVELSNYATKTNRKKLINAYSDKSPLCAIRFMPEDQTLVAISDNNKALCFNTEKIPLKTTKNTQGVQVLTLKKRNAKLIRVVPPEETSLGDIKYYSTKNIPAAGCFIKKEDSGQLSFE